MCSLFVLISSQPVCESEIYKSLALNWSLYTSMSLRGSWCYKIAEEQNHAQHYTVHIEGLRKMLPPSCWAEDRQEHWQSVKSYGEIAVCSTVL